MAGLAFDTDAEVLYGVDTGSDLLLMINQATGTGYPVGALGFGFVTCLAYDDVTNQLFGVDILTDQLIVIDTGSGAGTAIGQLKEGATVYKNISGCTFAGPLNFDPPGLNIPLPFWSLVAVAGLLILSLIKIMPRH